MSPASHLTALDFDKLRLDALSADQTVALRRHLDSCAACRQQAQAQGALVDHFLQAVLPQTLPAIRERLAPSSGGRGRRWLFVLAPLACGLVLLVVWGRGPSPMSALAPRNPPGDDLAIKGGGLLGYVRQGTSVRRLQDGAVLEQGDALRFAIDVGANKHMLIAGVDGGGKASAYYPYGRWEGAPLDGRGRFEVPGSIVLDDSPGPERIFAFLSHAPLDGAAIRSRLESLARLGPQAIRATLDVDVVGSERSSLIFEKKAKVR
jgi:hypothetical protein